MSWHSTWRFLFLPELFETATPGVLPIFFDQFSFLWQSVCVSNQYPPSCVFNQIRPSLLGRHQSIVVLYVLVLYYCTRLPGSPYNFGTYSLF